MPGPSSERRVCNSISNHLFHDLAQSVRVGPRAHRPGHDQFDRPVFSAEACGRLMQQFGHVRWLSIDGQQPVLEAGHVEQLADHTA
jgi:hypothetical protein